MTTTIARSSTAPPTGISAKAIGLRLILLGAILVSFGRIVTNDFVNWDDMLLIYGNKFVTEPSLSGIKHHWNPVDDANHQMYNPLVYTTWWVLAHAAQLDEPDITTSTLNPQIYHGANLIVHWLAACMVLQILLTLEFAEWAAVAGALLFALHPLQTESVAWATGMKDLLAGFLQLATLWQYLEAMKLTGTARRHRYWLATGLCFLSLLAKPTAVMLAPMAMAFDVLWYQRNWRRSLLRMIPWLAMALAATRLAQHIQTAAGVFEPPVIVRPMIAVDALAFYLYKIAVPIWLSFDYGRGPLAVLSDKSFHDPLYWTWVLPVVVAIAVWQSRKKEIWTGGTLFLLGVLPVLGFTKFVYQYYSTVADRYVYVAMLGLAIMMAYVLSRFGNRVVWIAAIVLLTVYSGLSFVQAGVWKNSDTLYEHGIELNATSALHYLVLGQYRSIQCDAAIRRAALAAHRGDHETEKSEIAEAMRYRLDAVKWYELTLRIDPTLAQTYDFLGIELVALGRLKEAIHIQRFRIADQPDLPPSIREKMDILYQTLGMLQLKDHEYADAAESFRKSLSYKDDPDVRLRLAAAEAGMKAMDATRASTQR